MIQDNTFVEAGADPALYEVGARVEFVSHDPGEVAVVPGAPFGPGDILVVESRNGCGMGIDVRRASDGLFDMVWPTEVRLARKVSP